MTRTLIVYGTNHGQAGKIAQAIADTLKSRNIDVEIAQAPTAFRPDEYAGVVVVASVHAGHYQPAVRNWVRVNAAVLKARQTAFVSVCLAVRDTRPKAQEDLRALLERFFAETGWRPTLTKVVAGALLYTQYNWIVRYVMKRIVASAGGDTDTSRDYEYTDWNDVRRFASEFGELVEAATSQRNGLVA